MSAEQIDALVFKTEQFRYEIDKLHQDFPALKNASGPSPPLPSASKIQLVMARMHLLAAGIKQVVDDYDKLVPEHQSAITRLEGISKMFAKEMQNICFAIWDSDPVRAKQDKLTTEKNYRLAFEKPEDGAALVPRKVPAPPAAVVEAKERPIYLRHFLTWAFTNACSSSGNDATIRIMRYDPVMKTWHFMNKSFSVTDGDVQMICMKADKIPIVARRWGGVITMDASSQAGITRTTAPIPDLSSAVDHGYEILAWRMYAKGQHKWLDAEGYSLSPLSRVVRDILDRAEV
ncbi:hypothetical protein ACHAPU_008209 [Fusarium lateritium]